MQEEEINLFTLKIVGQIRQDHPTMSLRAMYYKIKPERIGRDAFEHLCSQHGFKAEQKPGKPYTTDSNGVIRFENLLLGFDLTGINQVYSSDITYYEVSENFYYITFILDNFSRRIIGHSVSKRLTTEQTTLPALQQAMELRKKDLRPGIIFHSDGGGQYYAKIFLLLTNKYEMKNSMCEFAWENGKAERINGTIKNCYLTKRTITTFEELQLEVDRAVRLYNEERPHKSLKYVSPIEFEKSLIILPLQTSPTMTKSLRAKVQFFGASSPKKTGKQTLPTPNVLKANTRVRSN